MSSSLNLGHANPSLLNRFIKQSYLNPEACLAPFLTRSVIIITMAEGCELESLKNQKTAGKRTSEIMSSQDE